MQSDILDFPATLSACKRRRWLIVLTTLAVASTTLIYLLAIDPAYRATTLLQLSPNDPSIVIGQPNVTAEHEILSTRTDGEVAILRSEATALAVIKAADLASSPDYAPKLGWLERIGLALGTNLDNNSLRRLVGLAPKAEPTGQELAYGMIKQLQKSVQVRRYGPSYLIEITATSKDPARAADIANTYARAYLERQVEFKIATLLDTGGVLRRQIVSARNQLTQSDAAVTQFIDTNLAQLELESGRQDISELRALLKSMGDQRGALSARLIKGENAVSSNDLQTVAQALGDAALDELTRQRNEIRDRFASVTEGSLEAQELSDRLAALDKERTQTAARGLEELRRAKADLEKHEAQIRDELRAIILGADISSERMTDLFNLQQTAENARKLYQMLMMREQELRTQENLQIADVRIVAEALPPSQPSYPNKRLVLLIAIIGGVGLGVALALMKEFYFGGIVSRGQLESILHVRVAAVIPKVSIPASGVVADHIVLPAPSQYSESFQKLRAAIDLDGNLGLKGNGKDSPHKGKVILLTSALASEGKTAASIALARSYAQSGMKTLLIESDLRRSQIGKMLGVERKSGLFDFLASNEINGISQLAPSIDALSPLAVLAVGERQSGSTGDLINSAAFRILLERATEAFDVVILDTPPLLPLVDTRYAARLVDVVILVVRFGLAKQAEVREAAALLRESVCPETRFLSIFSHMEHGCYSYGYYHQDSDRE